MGVAVLVLEQAAERAKEIVAYAEQPEHWYRPWLSSPVPGDLPEHVLLNGNVRAVFSWTVTPEDPAKVHRHMSVSVRAEGRFPQPAMVWTLAHYFGFTGAVVDPKSGVVLQPAPGWGFLANPEEECVVVHEVIEGVDPQ